MLWVLVGYLLSPLCYLFLSDCLVLYPDNWLSRFDPLDNGPDPLDMDAILNG